MSDNHDYGFYGSGIDGYVHYRQAMRESEEAHRRSSYDADLYRTYDAYVPRNAPDPRKDKTESGCETYSSYQASMRGRRSSAPIPKKKTYNRYNLEEHPLLTGVLAEAGLVLALSIPIAILLSLLGYL